jgi:putative transposase
MYVREGRTTLSKDVRILTNIGTAVVVRAKSFGVELRDSIGDITFVAWADYTAAQTICDGKAMSLVGWLRPVWDVLSTKAKDETLRRLEVVQEVVTGYRDGHRELARAGEPRAPFGPGFGVSISKRCEVMALLLGEEGQHDRAKQRRILEGELKSAGNNPSTIRNWVKNWREDGLVGLIDKRSIRQSKGWDLIDVRFRRRARVEIDRLDGDISTVSKDEIYRRTLKSLHDEGITDFHIPQRITGEYLSTLKQSKGRTTRAQKSRTLQKVSGKQSYPAMRPGQVVAIDATRADNLVYDPLSGDAYSVEILTAIDVASRVVLALRVVAMSADGTDVGLLLYDICRPFSLAVRGEDIGNWRWVGLPGNLDLSDVAVSVGRRRLAPDFSTLQGEHPIPSLMPDAIHNDNASIFVSHWELGLLDLFGIDLLLSRPRDPSDNPQVERWHEILQRGLQQTPGYKGRNVSERGHLVADSPLFTAKQLEDTLRHFISCDYHRSHHTGLVLAGEELSNERAARLCPLEMYDAMIEATGRIDVPQRADLIYQFLPGRWLRVGHAGVEMRDVVYDSVALDGYREVARGAYRKKDGAMLFFYDPHDVSRLWFRDPETELVHPIPWRGANRIGAPVTSRTVEAARKLIRERGGNGVLKRHSATHQIIEEVGDLMTSEPKSADMRRKLRADRLRGEQSQRDHAEAQAAQTHRTLDNLIEGGARGRPRIDVDVLRRPWPNLIDKAQT